MARLIDLGQPDDSSDQNSPCVNLAARKVVLRWEQSTQARTTLVLATPLCTFGRASDRDVCLRIQPVANSENRQKTFQISSLHFQLRYSGEAVELVDSGSSNGTKTKSAGRLSPRASIALGFSDEISVADVLTLAVQTVRRTSPVAIEPAVQRRIADASEDRATLAQVLVGTDKPGSIEFVRLRRVDNYPDEEYVLLFGQGFIDSSDDAMIQLPRKVGTGSRGLDLGGDDAGPVARLFWLDGDLTIGVLRDGAVRLNDRDLDGGKSVALHPGDVFVADGVSIRVDA